MNDLISRKAVEKIIKEFFKTKIDEIPKRRKFNKQCDLCDLYLELNASLHKEIEDILVAYDVDKVVGQLKECERYVYDAVSDEDNYVIDTEKAIVIVKGGVEMEKEKVMPLTDNNFTEKLAEAITPAQFCLNIDGETVVFKPVQQADGSFLLIGKKDA